MKEDQNQRNKSVENENPKFMWEETIMAWQQFQRSPKLPRTGPKGHHIEIEWRNDVLNHLD